MLELDARGPGISRRVVLGALAVAVVGLYGYVLVVAFGYASALAVPPWWRDAVGHGRVALWAWIFPFDLLVTVAVSAPFARVIARYYRRTWLLLALLAAGILAGSGFAGLADFWAVVDGPNLALLAINTIRILAVLPLLTWLARQWRSSDRLRRPVNAPVPDGRRRPAAARLRR